MFVKIITIAVLAIIATTKGENEWTGFSAKWSTNSSDGYYTLPQTLEAAQVEGWTKISGVTEDEDTAALGYYGDPLVVLLFSLKTGDVFGMQVSIRVADVVETEVPLNYTANSALILKTLDGQDYHTATIYFYKNEKNNTRKIWVQDQTELVEIPTTAEMLESKLTSYVLSPCIKWMGVHYYRVRNVSDCSAIYPWLLLMVENDIIGIGFISVGHSVAGPKRTWFETLPNVLTAIQTTIPDAPACLAEDANAYGYSLFHTWFVSNPLDIICNSTYVASI